MHAGEVDHAAVVGGGLRVGTREVVLVRGVETFVERLQVAALHEVVALGR